MNALVFGRCPKAAEQLATFCNKVIIVLDHSFARERNLPELNDYEAVYSDVNISTPKGVIKKSIEIYQLVNKYQADIVFSNVKWGMVAAKIASMFIKRKVVLLATNHNSYSWLVDRNVDRMALLIRLTTDRYVALASFVKDKLLDRNIPEKRIIHVPNTVGFESWDVKDTYDIANRIKIVYVAYVYPEKRQDLLVDVLIKLNRKYNIQVDCYGDIDEFLDYVNEINEKVKTHGLRDCFKLLGPIDNGLLRSRLKDYDIYVSPSQMEMSPINILEAQAAGLPVVAANVGGIPDLIEDGKTGLLYEVNNLDELVGKVSLLADSKELREKIGRGGRKHVSTEYTKIEAGKRILGEVNEVLSQQ